MRFSPKGFTLVEVVIVVTILSFVFLSLSMILPFIISSFDNQKQLLDFQKKSLVDTTYLLDKTSSAERFISTASSGSLGYNNSSAVFLNPFNTKDFPLFLVSLFSSEDNKVSRSYTGSKRILWIKEFHVFSSFTRVGTDIYFTEPGKHIIKKMTSTGGDIVSAYGKEGVGGFDNSGTGIFNTPTGIASDTLGNLYVADTLNQVIRRISSTGVISTFAGSSRVPGYNADESTSTGTLLTSALFYDPTGLSYTGNTLYISDTLNNRIRKIDMTTSRVYTLAGGDTPGFNGDNVTAGSGNLNYPIGITAYASWILFADSLNGKIRSLSLDSGMIQTIAWVDTHGSNRDYSLDRYLRLDFTTQVQSFGTGIYFNDFKNGILYRLTPGDDGAIGTGDDTVTRHLGEFNNNILINGDIEKDFSGSENDISFSGITSIYTRTASLAGAPISGENYLSADTRWTHATGSMNFTSNPADGEVFQVGGYTYEFDTDTTGNPSNIAIPIASDLASTLENVAIELSQNPSISVTQTGSKFFLSAKDVGSVGNTVVFSGISPNYSLSPGTLTLGGGLSFGVGIQTFFFDKRLGDGAEYRLSFYIESLTGITSTPLDPLVEVFAGGGGNYKILDVNDSWRYHEMTVTGINPTGTGTQRIEFRLKNGNQYFLDNISLVSLGTRETDQDRRSFRIDIFPSFFLDGDNIFVTDLYNRRLKKVDTVPGNIATLSSDFSLFDPKNLVLGDEEDFLGNSFFDAFRFDAYQYSGLTATKMQYQLGNEQMLLKLVTNTKKYE